MGQSRSLIHCQPWLHVCMVVDEENSGCEGEAKDCGHGSEVGSDLDSELTNEQDQFFEAGKDCQQEEEQVMFLVRRE